MSSPASRAASRTDDSASDRVTLGEDALAQTVGGTATDVADNAETASLDGVKVDLSVRWFSAA